MPSLTGWNRKLHPRSIHVRGMWIRQWIRHRMIHTSLAFFVLWWRVYSLSHFAPFVIVFPFNVIDPLPLVEQLRPLERWKI